MLRTFEQLADTFVTAIVPFYALAVASIFVLRKRANYDPPFRTPLYPVVPALFILATLFLLGNAIVDPTSRWPTLAVLGHHPGWHSGLLRDGGSARASSRRRPDLG